MHSNISTSTHFEWAGETDSAGPLFSRHVPPLAWREDQSSQRYTPELPSGAIKADVGTYRSLSHVLYFLYFFVIRSDKQKMSLPWIHFKIGAITQKHSKNVYCKNYIN